MTEPILFAICVCVLGALPAAGQWLFDALIQTRRRDAVDFDIVPGDWIVFGNDGAFYVTSTKSPTEVEFDSGGAWSFG